MGVWRALLWLAFKSQFRLSLMKHRYFVKKERQWELAIYIFLLIALVPVSLFIVVFYQGLYLGFKWTGQPEAILWLAAGVGQLAVLLFGFFHVTGRLYFAEDSEGLLSLPVTPSQVFASRMFGIWAAEMPLFLLLTLPGFLVYGWLEGVGIDFYIKLVPIMMILPVVPLGVTAVLVMLFMRVTNFRRYREMIHALGPFILIMTMFGFQIVMNGGILEHMDEESTAAWLKDSSSILEMLKNAFPFAIWATDMITTSFIDGIMSWVLFLVGSLLAAIFAATLAKWLYYPGLVSNDRQYGKRGKALLKKIREPHSPLRALFGKEWRLLIRTPAFAMQVVLGVMIPPMAILLPMWVKGEWKQNLAELQALPFFHDLLIWSGVGAVVFLTGMNGVFLSSVSREGKLFSYSKTLPVSAGVQVLAKWLLALAFTGLITVMIGTLQFFMGAGGDVLFWTFLLGLTAGALTTGIGIGLDLLFPRLDWNTPQEVFRGGGKGLWMMLVQSLLGVVFGGIVWLLKMTGLPELLLNSLILILLLGADYGIFQGVKRLAERRYPDIEM
ncbi:putative ABC transporter permease subunit [Melghirimyces algeriensis]|uniref:ATP-binding cassette n=1 Tax=Melghirimyces algeriensis TaxID=910412 RepID=A0A521DY40_9BACL|nr:hypothetical protein [Melghirimyces algeriensis]SMO76586.1 Putative ATP-binding cassette [Melghirimyces algeriensis]